MIAALPSCSLLTPLDGFSSGDGDAAAAEASSPNDAGPTDDAPTDAAPERDAIDDAAADAPDAGPNLFSSYANGTFESGCPADGYNSTITVDATAHSGTKSCRVCSMSGTDDVFTLDEDVSGTAVVGARYRVTAWVLAAPGATPPSSGVFLALRTSSSQPFTVIDQAETPKVQVGATWQELSVDLDVTKKAPSFDTYVGGDIQGGRCFLVDDIEVHRLP